MSSHAMTFSPSENQDAGKKRAVPQCSHTACDFPQILQPRPKGAVSGVQDVRFDRLLSVLYGNVDRYEEKVSL